MVRIRVRSMGLMYPAGAPGYPYCLVDL
jgi:hypothetical protein